MVEHVKRHYVPTDPKAVTVDHIFSRARSNLSLRSHHWLMLNRVRACHYCNQRKGDMLPLEWLRIMPADGVSRYARRLLRLKLPASGIAMAIAERPGMPKATSAGILMWLLRGPKDDDDA